MEVYSGNDKVTLIEYKQWDVIVNGNTIAIIKVTRDGYEINDDSMIVYPTLEDAINQCIDTYERYG